MTAAQPAGAGPALADDDEPAIGTLRLYRPLRELRGSHGHVALAPTLFQVADLLMRSPDAPVDAAVIDRALSADPECQADRKPVRDHIQILRGAILVLTREKVQLREAPGPGYSIRVRPGRPIVGKPQ